MGDEVTRGKAKGALRPKDRFVVGASVGVTLNMGNYESFRLDCWAERPYDGTPEDAERQLIAVNNELEDYVNEKAIAYKALAGQKK
jgi:hypothetical protein